MSTRIEIRKTYKLYVGGSFIRSGSGRCSAALGPKGTVLGNVSQASRKDLRDSIVTARRAFDGWARKTAYLRGQILYRAAEMLECRSSELAEEIRRSTGASAVDSRDEVQACIDRLVYFAGWTDKFSQVFGTVNPVASPHFNFTSPEPAGVVTIFTPEKPSLLPLVTLIASTIQIGNAAVAIASEAHPLPSIAFSEILATSDLPGGVVNILTGKKADLAPHAASHMDINAIVDGSDDPQISQTLRGGVSTNLKRYSRRNLAPKEWRSSKGEDAYAMLDTVEFKTAWHPVGL